MKNFELIYKVRAANILTGSAGNIEVRMVNKARQEAQSLIKKRDEALAKILGTQDFEVTNIACMADGIEGHVYSPAGGVPSGAGRRKCVFCGLDDFDF